MRVGIVGGTGDEGFGLAVRLAFAGVDVTIGSRAAERAEEAAGRVRDVLDDRAAPVAGAENPAAVSGSDLVFVTVPYAGQAQIYRALTDHLDAGSIVCDTTSPLATAVGGRPWQVVTPWHGSAAEQAKALLPKGARLVAGFHTVSAEALAELDRDLQGDALLCGADDEAKAAVGALAERIPNLRWGDAGDLSAARLLEPLTAILVRVNRRYGIRDSGIGITGIPPGG